MSILHLSLLPHLVNILCTYCYRNNTNQFDCFLVASTKQNVIERVLCEGGPVFPLLFNRTYVWSGPYKECRLYSNISHVPAAWSRCQPNELSWNSMNSNCTDLYRRPHEYQCNPKSDGWVFYPTTPDFQSYSASLVYVACCIICCVLTVMLNFLNIFIFIMSKQLRSSKTIIFAVHMTIIDILVGTVLLPLYTVIVYHYHNHLFKGERKVSENSLNSMSTWFDRIDLLILIASFTNLAFMSLERCIVVVKPFWHMRNITIKKLLLLMPIIWAYALIGFFISQYALKGEWFRFSVGFITPTVVMVFSYVIIIYSIGKPSNAVSDDDDTMMRKRRTERKVTINLVMLIIVFLLCWIPYFVILLGYTEDLRSKNDDVSIKTTFRWMKLLSFCHCVFDPILYSFSRQNVRKEIKKMITGEKDKTKTSFGLASRSRVGTLHSAID